jgi:hypothetical protein
VPRLAEPSAIEIRPSVEPGGLRPPQHTAQRKAPPDPKVLEGMVRDPQGRPLADYPVTIIHDASPGTDSPGPAWSTRTRGDGMFVVQLPAPGRFQVHAGTLESQAGPLVFASLPVLDWHAPLELRADRTSSVELTLVPALDAVPAGALVEIRPQGDPSTALRVVTDAHGVARFDDILSGVWFVTARTAAGCCESAPVTLLPGSNKVSVALVRVLGR